MKNHFAARYGRAFVEILFFRPRSDDIRQLNLFFRISLYFLALALFYVPILYFVVKSSITDRELILYFLAIIAVHILSKVMLHNSKRVQERFSTIKNRKNFLLRIWLMAEYIAFMWVVYLFYPLSCILAPISLLVMSFENMLGYDIILNLFLRNSEQFIMFGGIVSYILFILADGYKKLKTGFLPDYLGLYALLSVISASIEISMRNVFEYFRLDIGGVSTVLSEIFSLSNKSMNIVASVMTGVFAIYSLYTNCGAVVEEAANGQALIEGEDGQEIKTDDKME